MKKQLLFLILLLFPMIANADAVEIDGIYYNLEAETKTAQITQNPNKYTNNVVIPTSVIYKGIEYSVTSIGDDAFNRCFSLTSVTIPNSVKSIGNSAFNLCRSLSSITIPNSVTIIGNDAFYDCSGLGSITFGNGVTSVGVSAFQSCTNLKAVHISDVAAWLKISFHSNPLYYAHHLYLNGEELHELLIPNSITNISAAFSYCSSLISVSIPNGVTSIEDCAFEGCTGLTSVNIPNSVTSFGIRVFKDCISLTNINIPQSVTNLGEEFFSGCTSLTSINIPNSVTSIGNRTFYGCTSLTSVNISNSVTNLGIRAFAGCSSLSTFTIPNGITNIDNYVLEDCTNLMSVTIGNNVSSIGLQAFKGCSNLEKLIVNGDNQVYDSRGNCNAIIASSTNELILGCKKTIIPNTVTSIGNKAFYGCKGLYKIAIPSSIKCIKEEAFKECSDLQKVIVDDLESWCNIDFAIAANGGTSPLQIAGHLYLGDKEIVDLIIPDNVSSIKTYAFAGCVGIKTVTCSNSVKSIGRSSFSYCNELETVVLSNNLESIGYSAFSWCTKIKTIKIPNTVVAIGDYAFAQCHSLESVKLSSSLSQLQYYCFFNCSNLISVVIPNSVNKIEQGVFRDCTQLKTIYMGSSLNHIMDEAFRNCENLSSIYCKAATPPTSSYPYFNYSATLYVPVNSISNYRGHSQWGGFNNIAAYPTISLTIDKSISEVNEEYIESIQELITSVVIPNTVKKISTSSFSNCNTLVKVTIEDGTEPLDFDQGDNFIGCPLESVYLGRNMKYITNSPFRYNKEGIKSLTFGENVTELGDVDFLGLTALTSLELPHSLKKIGSQTFYGCKGLTSLIIPNSVSEIGKQAFDLCTSLKSVTIEGGTEELAFVAEEGFVTNTFSNSPLEEITIGRNFSFASVSPFSIQENLSTITIGEKVTKLDDKSFTACPKLVNVTSYSEVVPTINDMAFTPSYLSNATLHVPYSLYDQYKVTPQWKDFGKIVNFEGLYNLVYIVDGVEYKKSVVEQGTSIVAEEEPTKEGHTFSGWSEIPNTMPDHDVTITGTFNINKYKLTYKIDEAEYKSYEVEFGASIIAEPTPQKEGYTFSGWSEIPATMPAHDVTITGSFSINKYKLTYQVDGVEYKTYEVEYNASITPEAEPTKEGYTFSGWSDIPTTMPAKDVTITGTFSINKYKLTYMIDDKVYKETMYEYGATITPEPKPEGDYATFEWKDLPQTMPAHDVVVYASYTSGIVEVLMATQRNMRIYTPNGKKLNKPQKGLNIIVLDDGTVKKVIVK